MSTVTVGGRTAGLIEGASGILRSIEAGEPSPFEGKSKPVPVWNPDGTEVESLQQVAAIMGTSMKAAALFVLEDDTAPNYLKTEAKMTTEQRNKKPHLPGGRYPIGNLHDLSNAVQAWGRCNPEDRPQLKRWLKKRANELDASQEMLDRIDRLDATKSYDDDMEEKVVRRVRTPAGRKRFGQPIGSIIVRDSIGKLNNIKDLGDSEYDGANDVQGADGKKYHVFEDPDSKGSFYATESTGDFWDTVVGGEGMSEEDVYIALDNHVAKKIGKPQKAPNKPQDRGNPRSRQPKDELAERSAAQQRREAAGFAREEAAKKKRTTRTGSHLRGEDTGKVPSVPRDVTKADYDELVEIQRGLNMAMQKLRRSDPKAKRMLRDVERISAELDRRDDITDAAAAKKPKVDKSEDRDLRGTQGVTLSEALELGKRQRWSKSERDEFLKLGGDGQADYLERVKELEGAGISYTHADVMDHVKGKPETNYTPDGFVSAANVKVGDVVAPSWAKDYPNKVVKVGPVTRTGKRTVYYEDGSRQTYRVNERLHKFAPRQSEPLGNYSERQLQDGLRSMRDQVTRSRRKGGPRLDPRVLVMISEYEAELRKRAEGN